LLRNVTQALRFFGAWRNAYKILVRRPEGETLRRLELKWEDNIRMNLRDMGWEGVDWIHLAHDRNQWGASVNTVMNLRVLQKAGHFLIR